MKDKLYILIPLVCAVMCIFGSFVSAKEIDKDNVPNNTYIIGNHMFTDKTILSTKHIMLGATTIESDKLSDMVIYYKTPWGAWWDGLSGEDIQVPEKFEVDYEDTVLQIINPVISSAEEVSDTDDLHGKKYNLVLGKINTMTGVRLYSATSENGEYTLVKDYKIEELTNSRIEVEVKGGYNYFYKVKAYKTVSHTEYSEFSNVVNIDNTLLQPGDSVGSGGYGPQEGEDETLDTVLLFNIENIKTALGNKPDGIEFYSSKTEDGEYTLLKKIAYEDIDVVDEYGTMQIPFSVRPGCENYFKIRSYIEYDKDTILYSEYRKIMYDATLTEPYVSKFQPLSGNSEDLTYNIDIYLGNMYATYYNRYVTGVDVLYSTEKDGEYTLLTSVPIKDMTISDGYFIANINVPVGNKYFIKLRKYVIVDDEKIEGKIYSIISEIESYTITYNLDGGEFYYQEGKYSFNVISPVVEFDIAHPRKNGYVFLGWTGSNGNIPQKDITVGTGTASNLTYTANWAKESFTVKYNKNNDDATGTMEDTTCTYGTTCNLRSSAFTLENYEVIGWSTTVDGEVEYELGADVSDLVLTDKDSITLYAVWGLKKYEITYNLDGGKVENNPTYFTIETDDTDTVIGQQIYVEYPTKEGYTFEGWSGTGFERTTPNLASPDGCWLTITNLSDIELTATWERIQWRIMYSPGDGIVVTGGIMETTCFDYSEKGTLAINTMQRKGYEFVGWATEEGGKLVYTDGQSGITLEYNNLYGYGITLYAVWNPIEYTISYVLGANAYVTYPYNPTTYTIEDSVELIKPTRSGYTFKGWTGNNGETPQEDVTISKGTTGNLIYTANWELNTYSLTFFVKTPDLTENIESNYKRYGYNGNYYTEYINANGTVPTQYTVESDTINLSEVFSVTNGYSLKFYITENVILEDGTQELQLVELTEFPKTYHMEFNGQEIENKSSGNEYIYIEVIPNN